MQYLQYRNMVSNLRISNISKQTKPTYLVNNTMANKPDVNIPILQKGELTVGKVSHNVLNFTCYVKKSYQQVKLVLITAEE